VDDHTKFHVKFLELVSAKSLSKRGIIDTDAFLKTSVYNRELASLKPKDAECLALLSAGFSYRELAVIYGLKNCNCAYVKCHRLRDRLSKKMKQIIDEQQSGRPA
jgi:hypothetical protein